jgi:hypothetical protein
MKPADSIETSPSASPPPMLPDLEQQFLRLVEIWRKATQYTSSMSDLVNHPAYQQIIGLGQPAIPLLLRELERDPDYWFAALRALTGVDPVPAASRGNLARMAEAWLAWGRQEGYRW